jgi:hypothetical protein
VRPQGLDELGAAALAVAVCRQVSEQHSALTRRQCLLEPTAFDLDDQSAAKLDSVLQGGSKLIATWPPDNAVTATSPTREERPMAKVINCECGHVVRGETDDELVAAAQEHINRDHPDLVGKVSRDDLLGMAEQA